MVVLDWCEIQLLMVLWHLRYLSTKQVHQLWYPERSLESCSRRLGRLAAEKILIRVDLRYSPWTAAWSLGVVGLKKLRDALEQPIKATRPVGATFLPHLLSTNEVFVHLRGEPLAWDQLPFEWVGSHRIEVPYRDRDRRSRALRPDALIVGRGEKSPRIFVELDRSTERIRHADGQRSIERKLKAYAQVLYGAPADGGERWYQRHFQDDRPARIVFVLGKSDERAASDQARDRRMRSILEMAAAVGGLGRRLPLHVVYLHDGDDVRRACSLGNTVPPKPGPVRPPVSLTDDHASAVKAFYNISYEAYRRLNPKSRVRDPWQRAAQSMREVLALLEERSS